MKFNNTFGHIYVQARDDFFQFIFNYMLKAKKGVLMTSIFFVLFKSIKNIPVIQKISKIPFKSNCHQQTTNMEHE